MMTARVRGSALLPLYPPMLARAILALYGYMAEVSSVARDRRHYNELTSDFRIPGWFGRI